MYTYSNWILYTSDSVARKNIINKCVVPMYEKDVVIHGPFPGMHTYGKLHCGSMTFGNGREKGTQS